MTIDTHNPVEMIRMSEEIETIQISKDHQDNTNIEVQIRGEKEVSNEISKEETETMSNQVEEGQMETAGVMTERQIEMNSMNIRGEGKMIGREEIMIIGEGGIRPGVGGKIGNSGNIGEETGENRQRKRRGNLENTSMEVDPCLRKDFCLLMSLKGDPLQGRSGKKRSGQSQGRVEKSLWKKRREKGKILILRKTRGKGR